MWQTVFLPLIVGCAGASVGALATAYFSNRSIGTKLAIVEGDISTDIAEINGKLEAHIKDEKIMYKIAEIVVNRHNKELHKDSMYEFVEGEIIKHHKTCGDEVDETLKTFGSNVDKLEGKLQHMELKQVKTNMKLNIITSMVSEIAKKMEIRIDPTKLTGEDNE